jgi:hypothetical protein
MNALPPATVPEPGKEDSAPSTDGRSCEYRIRSGKLVARLVAVCFCLLTFAQLASAHPILAARSCPQVVACKFIRFPCEEAGNNTADASTPTVVQFGKVGVRPSPRRGFLRAHAFVRLQPPPLVHRRILPAASDHDH